MQPSAATALAAESSSRSLDPLSQTWAGEWQPGQLKTIASPDEFERLTATHADKLMLLMCKSHACRPCKMFTRKYLSLAAKFPECVFCEVYGDDTPETRKWMMAMAIKVTPTFKLWRGGQCVNTLTGTNDKKLLKGVLSHLAPTELLAHAQEIEESIADEEQQPEAAGAAQ